MPKPKPTTPATASSIQRLQEVIELGKNMECRATFELGDDNFLTCAFEVEYCGFDFRAYFFRVLGDRIKTESIAEGMVIVKEAMQDRVKGLASVAIKTSKNPTPMKEFKAIAEAAWREATGLSAPDLTAGTDEVQAKTIAMRDKLLDQLRSGQEGVQTYNDSGRIYLEKAGSFKNSDLHGADLRGVLLGTPQDGRFLDFKSSNFDDVVMDSKSYVFNCDLSKSTFCNTRFTGARIDSCRMHDTQFSDASFSNTKMSKVVFRRTNLQQVDFSDAKLEECEFIATDLSSANLSGIEFENTYYDADTKWPSGFVPPTQGLFFKGDGTDPLLPLRLQELVPQGNIDFPKFVACLNEMFDEGRVEKALEMLKTQRFQLFDQVSDDGVAGVVKSQTKKDRVYSCKLTRDGAFFCCTQNLIACGGMRSELCKHLFVLVIGLTKAGKLDPAVVCNWVMASKSRKPDVDRETAGELFMNYAGYSSGELDWRPTETIPEDYYAF